VTSDRRPWLVRRGRRRAQAEFELSSRLEAPVETVWARVTTVAGVNAELMPIARMTAPRGTDSIDPDDVTLGARLFRSWILLGGLVPIDYDDVTLVRVERNRGFLERSPMLSQRLWEHERTLEPLAAGGCRVIDRVRFEPRPPVPARWLRPLFRAVFRHRHRRLRREFGGGPG
jgi:ligand-binding SRPBCC domain-containing protein